MRIPDATYRLQLHAGFGLEPARQLLDHLERLGISDLYVSPLLQARRGSPHGYDVVDPTQIDAERGGEPALRELVAALAKREMGLVLDIVPNHMAASTENPWWRDVLRNGRRSPYAYFFDIDWQWGGDKLVLPLLGAPLEDLLERGELNVAEAPDGLELRYQEHALPLVPPEGATGPPRDRDELLRWLADQPWRLLPSREGARQINYRRFFDVDSLVAVRSESRRVFDALHGRVLELVRDGAVQGLRIDHVDGLCDPQGYLERLRAELERAGHGDLYLVVEKILVGDEELHPDWPVQGTTGYEFGAALRHVFVDLRGFLELDRIYRRQTGLETNFAEVDHAARLRVLRELFPADMARLLECLEMLGARAIAERRVTPETLAGALEQITVGMPVYRTYVRDDAVLPRDRDVVEEASEEAAKREPRVVRRGLELARRALLLEVEDRRAALELVQRWQQLTGPVMAKGHEDTALYRYHRLLALNSVGVDPGVPPDGLTAFHAFNERRVGNSPHALNATSTHDSKRSEDVRARLQVLSELPAQWEAAVVRWKAANHHRRRSVQGREVPDANLEYFVYQTLIGVWPAEGAELSATALSELRERLIGYFVKASREAKQQTSWLEPDVEHERELSAFVTDLLSPEARADFRDDFLAVQRKIALHGARNSLAQVLLKVTSPGVPDFYQGSELWDLSLVDPDNRRPVDFALRSAVLDELDREPLDELIPRWLESWTDGRIKTLITARALRWRRSRSALLRRGNYLRLSVTGPLARHVCAFARVAGGQWSVTAVPRLLAGPLEAAGAPASERLLPPPEIWGDTRVHLPSGAPQIWRDVLSDCEHRLSGGELAAARLFANLPVALLAI